MKNNFCKFLSIMIIAFMIFSSITVVFAESQKDVDITIDKTLVIISGTISEGIDDITLQVTRNSDGKRVYIDQIKTDELGHFSVSMALEQGGYSLLAVSSKERVEKEFTVAYETSYVNILVNKNLVTISGVIVENADDITLQVNRSSDGKRVYLDQIRPNESGYFSISITLEKGTYKLLVVSSDGRIEKEFTVTYEGSSGGGNNGGSQGGGSGGSGGGGSSGGGTVGSNAKGKPEELGEKEDPPKKTFNDLENFPWAKEEVESLATRGIMHGISDDAFTPEVNITRGDFTGALIRALGLTAEFEGNFMDIGVDDPYYNDIGIARALGIAKGVGNNKLDPKAFITRQDMMVLVERALRIAKLLGKNANLEYLESFGDKDQISSYAIECVALMVEEGYIKGDGQNINPKGNTTRAEAAVILYRLYNQFYGIKETS
jgi:hypothetical protein